MTDFAQLTSITVPFDSIVTLTFYLVTGAYAIFSAVLYYHWKTYAADNKVSALTLILYFSITVPIVLAMAILALIIV